NMEEAFRAAHTLKGVGLNLSLTKLHKSASAMTEALRGKTDYSAEYEPLFEQVKADYELTVSCIRALD
ncbi:MAG: Hpt domain-containing protein, partial [Clostridiales bacterium]|nr:Hpt domain-containing protein [Clostridiales bacterium]